MPNAIAFTNNDVITIAWSYDKKPTGCMGFAIYRINEKNNETPLPSHAVFPGEQIKSGQTTEDFPVQKFYWKDVYARLIAEDTKNNKFHYKVVPLEKGNGKLIPMKTLPVLITNEVEISPVITNNISAFFNRGLISTQRVSRAFKGDPNKVSLLKKIETLNDPLRESLAGDMIGALTGFVAKADTKGKIYAALYELGDELLIQKLESLKNRLYIILSNAVKEIDDPDKEPKLGKDGKMKKPKMKIDSNDPARERIKSSTKNLFNRIMPDKHIGHNKFLVYVDENDNPKAVLLGSTNWTPTGLCTQTNNTLIIEDPTLASRYLNYWNELLKDTEAANGISKKLQGTDLRKWDAKDKTLSFANISSIQSWFSPNTPNQRGNKKKNEICPPDMDTVIKCINGAEHAILFLAFYPGSPSIAQWTAHVFKKKKDLFVRGCVTNKSAAEGFYYELKGMIIPKKVKGVKTPVKEDPRVIGAEAFDGKSIPEGWQKEILSAGFAIIHDKIVVIDPFSDNCYVITGSHNLGYTASYNNDENLVIIKGNKKLAAAYATHVLDVYDHFTSRYLNNHPGPEGTDFNLKKTPDEWLDKYFDKQGKLKSSQLKFWMEATHN